MANAEALAEKRALIEQLMQEANQKQEYLVSAAPKVNFMLASHGVCGVQHQDAAEDPLELVHSHLSHLS